MADDITLSTNIGSGAVIATEDEGSVHYQKIKLTASGTGTTEALSKAEDTTHTTGEHGIMALAVRRDADTSLVGTDGDYAPLQVDANGYLKVETFDGGDSHTVDNAGTFATQATLQAGTAEFGKLAAGVAEIGNIKNSGTFVTQIDGAALTSLQLIDNIVHVDDAAFTLGTHSGVMMMGFAGTQSVNANDAGAIAMETDGAIHIHDGGNSLTVDGTVTANPASGTIDTVTTVSTVTTVTNDVNIADGGNSITVDNGGTFVTQIDGAALTALQVIDNPVFVDDAAFTLTSSSVMMSGAIRDDALTTLTAVEGDAVPLRVGSTGALHVTGGGGGTEYTEDVATANPIVGTATMMERDDIIGTLTPVAGDWASFRCSAEGALWVQDFNSDANLAANVAVQAAVEGTLTVGSHAVTNAGTFVTQSTLDAETTKVIGTINVAAAQTIATTNAGTFAVQSTLQAGTAAFGKLSANSGVDIGDVDILSLPASTNTLEVVGDVAHDAAAAGNPVLIAGRATASVEGITEVAEADSTFLNADLSGTIITRSACAHAELVSFYVANTDGAEDAVTSLDDGGAAIYNFITSVSIHNAHATTNGYVTLLDGTGGTVFWLFPAPATGGCVVQFDPPLRQPTISTALYVDVSAAITTMHISINGYQGNG